MTQDDILRMARQCFADPDGSLELLTPELTEFAAIVAAAEREAISDEYAARLQGDLENGVRRLNEAAASEFHKKYPQLASFNEWLNERGNI